MIDVVRGLGPNGTAPLIYAFVPVPLMQEGAYGMNETVINTILPQIVPLVKAKSRVDGIIDLTTDTTRGR